MLSIAVYGTWQPRPVFEALTDRPANAAPMIGNFKRLISYRPVYPALLIWLLWNFAPGSQTALQFYLQNTLHAADAQWGQWNAIFTVSYVPTIILFGFLCQKYALRKLPIWGTIVAIPQVVPLLFLHSMTEALLAAVAIGLMGGVATTAYIDLLIRSCPRGLEGTTMMLAGSIYYVVVRFGDILGAALYDRYRGFSACVIAITVAYALILPALLLVPGRLIATADGEKSRRRIRRELMRQVTKPG